MRKRSPNVAPSASTAADTDLMVMMMAISVFAALAIALSLLCRRRSACVPKMHVRVMYSSRRKEKKTAPRSASPASTIPSATTSRQSTQTGTHEEVVVTAASTLRPAARTVNPVIKPPSCPHDQRIPVRDLLAKHATELIALRELVAVDSLYDAARHDDLWLLRFFLSHSKGGVAAAAKAARYTLAWRETHRMDALAAELETIPAIAHPNVTTAHAVHVKPHGIRFLVPDGTRGPILFAHMIDFDYVATMKHVSREAYASMMRTMNEWYFMQCDRVTRETGLLTKSCRFIQCRGLAVGALDRQWLKMDGQVAKDMEDCYPQGLGLIICLDPPAWSLVVWKAAKFFFPARMVEKIDLLSTRSASGRSALHKRALPYLDLADLPAAYGGEGADFVTEDGRHR